MLQTGTAGSATNTQLARTAASSPQPASARGARNGGESISTEYRGVKLYQMAPPAQGFSVLQMPNLIETYEFAQMEYLGAGHAHGIRIDHVTGARRDAARDRKINPAAKSEELAGTVQFRV